MTVQGQLQQENYDDIIVGAGSSGAVIASRLSENSERRVLLLEAGPDYSKLEQLPLELRDCNGPVMEGHNWHIHPQVQKRGQVAASYNSAPSFDYAFGKVTGGSSAINGAIALRGEPEDFDEWIEYGGNEWSWGEVLPFFQAIEDDPDGSELYHGRGGPMPIYRARTGQLVRLQAGFREACISRGFREAPDLNDPQATGVGPLPKNVLNNVRMSTSMTYLQQARNRPNLTIMSGVHVHRLLWNGTNVVEGVEAEQNGAIVQLRADRVILCAGALHSPAILMRSGIGDPSVLRVANVSVKHALHGVGANLSDHHAVGIWAVPRSDATALGEPTHQVLLKYTTDAAASRNNMHVYMLSGIDTRLFPLLQSALRSPAACAVSACLMKPKSRGSVRILSSDPHRQPHVEVNCLSEPEDAHQLREGVRMAWELMQHPQLRDYIDKPLAWTDGLMKSNVAMDQAIATFVRPGWHPVGTARMGKVSDDGAVVDSRGRVHGIDNLWVADASIMPTVPSAPTNLSCIMIGEKLAAGLRQG